MASPQEPGWKLYRLRFMKFVQFMKQAGEGPTCLLPPGVGAWAVPSKVEPTSVIHALSMQLQHPPAFGVPGGHT